MQITCQHRNPFICNTQQLWFKQQLLRRPVCLQLSAGAAAAGNGDHATTAAAATPCQQRREYELVEERGLQFTPGVAFYRAESAQGRDLAVLAAAVYKRQTGRLRVLDVMAGSGMRGARYLTQADADIVWCNDYDRRNSLALVYNLVSSLQQYSASCGSRSSSHSNDVVSHADSWLAAAQEVQYEGIRGIVLQWDSGSISQQEQPEEEYLAGQQLHRYLQQQDMQYLQQNQQRKQPWQQWQQDQLDLVQQHQQLVRQQVQQQQAQYGQGQCCRMSHVDASRLLASVYLQEDYWDLVDVDSFGSDASCLPAALHAVKYGGLLYLTSTDGFCSAGKRPQRSLAAYGSYLRALPHANEQGLRMLIGAAAKEAASKGLAVQPLFSLYSYHGPVFRVMLRVTRSNEGMDTGNYAFVGHCYVHGENCRVGWTRLSQAWCRCKPSISQLREQATAAKAVATAAEALQTCRPTPLVLSGPMWTGPLHDQGFVAEMASLAAEWGWKGTAVPANSPHMVRQSKNNKQRPLEALLASLQEEANPALPPWYICIDTLAQHLDTTPSRDKLIKALQTRGYAACLCHIENRALRTTATTQQVLQVAVENCGHKYRQAGVPQVLLQHHETMGVMETDDI